MSAPKVWLKFLGPNVEDLMECVTSFRISGKLNSVLLKLVTYTNLANLT